MRLIFPGGFRSDGYTVTGADGTRLATLDTTDPFMVTTLCGAANMRAAIALALVTMSAAKQVPPCIAEGIAMLVAVTNQLQHALAEARAQEGKEVWEQWMMELAQN